MPIASSSFTVYLVTRKAQVQLKAVDMAEEVPFKKVDWHLILFAGIYRNWFEDIGKSSVVFNTFGLQGKELSVHHPRKRPVANREEKLIHDQRDHGQPPEAVDHLGAEPILGNADLGGRGK